jgi:hypothetical protein
MLKFSIGTTGVSFSAPVPVEAGLQWTGDTPLNGFSETGNSQTHADVSPGNCQSGTLVVMEMHFVRVGNAEACVPYAIQPGASDIDCSSVEHPADSDRNVALNSNGCLAAPYRHPFPADGAVDVPLKTILNWDDRTLIKCTEPIAAAAATPPTFGQVYFGTTTNPPYDESATYYHGVGPLLPETTYYWRIDAQFPQIASPLWSFTTMSTVATQPSTWGAIKALYR